MGLMQAIELVEDRESKPPRRSHRRSDGSRARKPPADRQRRHLRQRDPHYSAPEHLEEDVDDFVLRLGASLDQVARTRQPAAASPLSAPR